MGFLIKVVLLFLLSFQVCSKEIVFILGSDMPGEADFYSAAAEYYRSRNKASPLVLVTTARSLSEVREVLQRTKNDGPWDEVTLVSHGSYWRGMNVDIYPDGTDATLENIEKVLLSGEFPGLPASKINQHTVIKLESCSVGRRPDYLEAIARLFIADKSALPRVEASENFIAFSVLENADGVKTSRRTELPAVIRTLPVNFGKMSDSDVAAELDNTRNALNAKMAGAGHEAVWTVAPMNLVIKVALPARHKMSPVQIASGNEFVGNAVRVHGIAVGDMQWELNPHYDDEGRQELHGHAVFILMHANLNFVNTAVLTARDATAH